MKGLNGKTLKNAVNWLMSEQGGTVRFCELEDNSNKKWSIVLGWSSGFDDLDNDLYQVEDFKICSKIAYNCDDLQCDFEFDFEMPCNDMGDVYDTCSYIGNITTEKQFDSLADELKKQFICFVSKYGNFETKQIKKLIA